MRLTLIAVITALSLAGCAARDPVRDINQAVTDLDRSIWPEWPTAKPLKPEGVKPLK